MNPTALLPPLVGSSLRRDVVIRWSTLFALYGCAALLSAIQIYYRQTQEGALATWSVQIYSNLIAWLPWIPITALIQQLIRRLEATRASLGWVVSAHSASAVAISFGYLSYLALFRIVLETGSLYSTTLGRFTETLELEVGEFFTICLILYALIAVASVAWNHRRRPDQACSQPSASPSRSRIEIRSLGHTRFIDIPAIDWIEGAGSYSRIHFQNRSHLIRQSLKSLAERLNEDGFVRIHRSAIVNLARVVRIRRVGHGDAIVRLKDDTELRASRTYREALERRSRGGC